MLTLNIHWNIQGWNTAVVHTGWLSVPVSVADWEFDRRLNGDWFYGSSCCSIWLWCSSDTVVFCECQSVPESLSSHTVIHGHGSHHPLQLWDSTRIPRVQDTTEHQYTHTLLPKNTVECKATQYRWLKRHQPTTNESTGEHSNS